MSNVLVVQFREESDASKQHEQECILRRAPHPETIRFVSVFADVELLSQPEKLLTGVDKLVFGGNAAVQVIVRDDPTHDHSKGDAVLQAITPLSRYILKQDFPTLATCFGHQLFAHLLGAPVVRDPAQAETGYFDIVLTPAGQADPLFTGISSTFSAILGHNLSVNALPGGATLLASSARHRFQALRYGKNVYTTQFHSELDDDDLAFRLSLFPAYKANATEESLVQQSSPYGVQILRNFLAN